MTDTSVTPYDVFSFDRGRLSQRHSTWTVAGAGAITLGVLMGSFLVDARLQADRVPDAGTARLAAAFRSPLPAALPGLIRRAPRQATAPVRVEVDAALLAPAFTLGPSAMADNAPLEARFVPAQPAAPVREAAAPAAEPAAPVASPQIALLVPLPEAPHDTAPVPVPSPVAAATPQVEAARPGAVPLPEPRPAFRWAAPEQYRASRRQTAKNTDTAPTPAAPGAVAAAPADNRGFLERFFGALKPTGGPALGYASSEDGLFRRSSAIPGGGFTPHDRYTAVYDISAHTVTLPDGARLEAHSGLGGMMDDPRHVTARNTGPTPPHLYDLTLRESLFHGVQALRLNPVGGGGVYGRDGLLAHTYMLGPNGQSNGCVSFRDYQAFLRAYQSGQIKRLAVVPGVG